jgi:ketosteroid isomerase-like protein
MTTNRMQDLLDKQDCAELVYRFARGVDRCDADQIRAVFWPDATDDHGIVKGTVEEYLAQVMLILDSMKSTQHMLGQVLIELAGDTATGETYFCAQHTLPGADGGPDQEMFAAGRYLDRFERRDGVWKIIHRSAVYDWNTVDASTTNWTTEPMKSLLARGLRGAADPSSAYIASK